MSFPARWSGVTGTASLHPSERFGSGSDANDRMVARLDPITHSPCHTLLTQQHGLQRLLTFALDQHRDTMRYNLRSKSPRRVPHQT
jgi:hypothetical protein